jgi:DNA-directed RNA polymerase specialized sigma24 family protein
LCGGAGPAKVIRQPLNVRTIRELRRQGALAPGNSEFEQLTREYLPLVYGTAALLLPEAPGSLSAVATAAFQTLRFRLRRVPQRTVVASWLVRTAWFIGMRERRRLRLAEPLPESVSAMHRRFVKRLNQLRTPLLDALVLRFVLHEPAEAAARILRRKPSRVDKLAHRALARMSKAVRKFPAAAGAGELLAGLVAPVPAEVEEAVLTALREPLPRRPQDDLVRSAVAAWRWVRCKGVLRRALVGAASVLGVLLVLGGTFAWLATHGYLTAWFIRHFNGGLVKEFPELGQPAKPWPDAQGARAGQTSPGTAAELYGLTNIWTARLAFSPAAWRALQPGRVPPSNMNQPDGRMSLRNPNARRNGLAGVIGLDFDWVEASLTFAGVEYPKVGVRYRGNGTYVNSLYGPKQSLKVDLNRFSKEQSLAGVHTLNFVNAIPDFSYLHDALAERFFRDLGVPAPRTAFAYLTVDAPGSLNVRPLGLYVLVENIDATFALDRFGSKKIPIFKPVTADLFRDLGSDWKAYAGIYDLKTKATPDQLQRVIDFARLVTSANDEEFARRLQDFLDLEEFAGFVAGHALLSSYDGFLTNGQNFYMYLLPDSNRFGFIPWDQDHGWGEFGYVATADQRERASLWQPCSYDNRFLDRVLKVEAFRSIYRKTLERARQDLFTVERLYAQIDALAPVIRPAIAAESDFRLHRFDQALSTNWVAGPRDGAPEGPRAPVHQMKRFIANRVRSVQEQLDGKTEGVLLHRGGRR